MKVRAEILEGRALNLDPSKLRLRFRLGTFEVEGFHGDLLIVV